MLQPRTEVKKKKKKEKGPTSCNRPCRGIKDCVVKSIGVIILSQEGFKRMLSCI